jgi:hypothetical protein
LLQRELAICKSIRHKHIVPFIGVAQIEGRLLSLVTACMEKGQYFVLHNLLLPNKVTNWPPLSKEH